MGFSNKMELSPYSNWLMLVFMSIDACFLDHISGYLSKLSYLIRVLQLIVCDIQGTQSTVRVGPSLSCSWDSFIFPCLIV